jgi:simple sugar transport system permease protein
MSDNSTATAAPRIAVPRDRNILRLSIFLAAVFLLMTALRPSIFLMPSNFNSMMRQFPEYGIMAIGISLTMITGGMDLAVVGTANLSAIIAAKFLLAEVPRGAPPEQALPMIIVAVLLALICGLACGAFSGFLIARMRIPAILATLGTQQLFTGIAIVITNGRPQSRLPLLYSQIGNTELWDFIPLPFVIFCAVAIIIGLALSKTRFGPKLYMLGTNAKAARFAGLNNEGILVRTYMISGFLSSIAGLIMMARANSAKADYGASYTMQCILIAVLGGVDPNGGFGKIGGVTIAILILQVLSSGLNMFENVSNFYRDVIWGGVLIIVLVINLVVDGKARRNGARA